MTSREVTVVAKHAVEIFRPVLLSQQSVHLPARSPSLFPMLIPTAESMIKTEELRLGYVAPARTLALAAVGLVELVADPLAVLPGAGPAVRGAVLQPAAGGAAGVTEVLHAYATTRPASDYAST